MQIVLNKYYSLKSKAFSHSYLKHLGKQILFSPYLAASNLSNSFTGTQGFSIVFKRSRIDQVVDHFPFLQQYLAITLNATCNAFYLNPLVINSGTIVEPHVDSSISFYTKATTIPMIVNVLYVKIPPDLRGGELQLQKSDHKIEKIKPQANTLLYFRGNLKHSVSKVESSQARISLVCEQYNLTENILNLIPEFRIETGSPK
ncbi:MAG: 2OG-Fe(II) oxygenase [Waterburya sp.]